MKLKKNSTIEWLCAVPARSLHDLEQSNLASVRLRTTVGIRSALSLGYKSILSDGRETQSAQAVVVNKLDFVTDPTRPGRWLQRLRQLKAGGTRVIVDYTDHHMATESPAAGFYREAIALCDTIVASSNRLCEHIAVHTGRKAVMIDDPIEVALQTPTARSNQTRTALWFGHATNLPYLFDFLVNRYESHAERRLILMTNLHPLPEQYLSLLDVPQLKKLEISIVPWSTKDLLTAASLSDFCLLPAGVSDPRKSGASSNRLLTALAMGLPTAADLLDSYLPFSDYFSDLARVDINVLFDDPERFFPRVQAAQRHISKDHTIKGAQLRWAELLRN
jgi:hypothetical protein